MPNKLNKIEPNSKTKQSQTKNMVGRPTENFISCTKSYNGLFFDVRKAWTTKAGQAIVRMTM